MIIGKSTLGKFAITVIMICACCTGYARDNNESESMKIREALQYQLAQYPYSQYRDVYKNFMQDYFGPGHILADTVAAGRYLGKELAETKIFGGPDYELTGFNGNFYRVNLRLIADGQIPYQTFFDAFVESVQNIVLPSAEEWTTTWKAIDREIRNLNMNFENEEEDRQALERQFAEGNFIVHHSKVFDENSDFHYRIISKEKFYETILPLITSPNEQKP